MEHNRNKRTNESEFEPRKRHQDLGGTVASHYNSRNDQGLKEREKSRIFYMRNYNNWIKSMLINDALRRLKTRTSNRRISVLDLCSGKGGDLLKWKVAGVGKLFCADIASTSVEHCKSRYEDLAKRSGRDRNELFSAKFFTADCSKERISELENFGKDETFDITSCQFALHYSFESLAQARMMLKNACERLKLGGLLIGTLPNANVLMRRLREAEGMSFGNDIYRVEFDAEFDDKEHMPLFGAKYHFFLEGAVNCPEFLVYFPLLEDLAREQGMKLILASTFKDFHDAHSTTEEGRNLLRKMSALEQFPPQHGEPVGEEPQDYDHARSALDTTEGRSQLFTLSRSEWEATNLYSVFMFEKVEEPASMA